MHHPLPKPSPTVVFQQLDDGAVLFCSRTEVYFGLNDVGTFIWNQLPALSRMDELDGAMADRFKDAPADVLRADAREFLDALLSYELVVHAPAPDAE